MLYYPWVNTFLRWSTWHSHQQCCDQIWGQPVNGADCCWLFNSVQCLAQSQAGLCLLTSPMSVCACVSVTALASATNALKVYQKKSTRRREQINVGIDLKILGSKVITVISLPWNLHLTLKAENRRQQVTSAVRRKLLVRQVLCLHL